MGKLSDQTEVTQPQSQASLLHTPQRALCEDLWLDSFVRAGSPEVGAFRRQVLLFLYGVPLGLQ